MAISLARVDRRIARLRKKLETMQAVQDEILKLEAARERVAELEAMFPTRSRGSRKTEGKTTAKKTTAKKTTAKKTTAKKTTAKRSAAKKTASH
jgi:topoisomerase IA-like protein